MLELPPLRVPQAGNIAVKTLARIEWYLREALPLFVVGTLILYVLDRFGGLALLERAAAPLVVGVLDLPKEAAAAFILGFLRRDYAAGGPLPPLRAVHGRGRRSRARCRSRSWSRSSRSRSSSRASRTSS